MSNLNNLSEEQLVDLVLTQAEMVERFYSSWGVNTPDAVKGVCRAVPALRAIRGGRIGGIQWVTFFSRPEPFWFGR